MEPIGRAAFGAAPFVSLPDFEFHLCRDQTTLRELRVPDAVCCDCLISKHQLELEDLPELVSLFPRVLKHELTVVGPYALVKLLVDSNESRKAAASFEVIGGLVERPFSVLEPEGVNCG